MKRLFLFLFIFYSTHLLGAPIDDFTYHYWGERVRIESKKDFIPSEDIAEAGELADIYFILQENEPIAVIKGYEKGEEAKKQFDIERQAYDRLSRRVGGAFPTPKMLFHGEDEEHYYLTLEVAAGQTINRWMRMGLKSREAYEAMLEGVEASARHLRTFHTYYLSLPLKKRSHQFKRAKQVLTRYMEGEALPLPREIHLAQIHGDLHPGNVFYSEEEGVSFIDLSRLTNPLMTHEGDPIAHDVMKYLITLQACAEGYGHSRGTLKAIEEAFWRGYGDDLLTQEEIDYFGLVEALDILDAFRSNEQLKQEQSRELIKQSKGIYTFCHRYASNLCESSQIAFSP